MLNRTKLALSLALCASFSFAAQAEEVTAAASEAANNVVIVVCGASTLAPDAAANPSYIVASITPPGFNAVDISINDDCAVAIAKMNHYKWDTEFFTTDAFQVLPIAESAGPTLVSAATYSLRKQP